MNAKNAEAFGDGSPFSIRDERPFYADAIFELTREAFRGHPHSEGTEPLIVNALRDAGALALSLVAELGGKVIGHVAFSPVSISDGSLAWYGMGPLSVLPGFQGRGAGSALVREGLERLGPIGGKGCVLVGEPKYYGRFGFRNIPTLVYEGIPQEYFLALRLGLESGSGWPNGMVTFHAGFSVRSN
ncbi:MAG: N-acetyltransferase [Synergistaceae bacterium]|jgi:putative acetyltransferase|nr:N-acetyltransferase [Synergistaceae bacterium]